MRELEQFRKMKDRFFRHDPNSPLLPEQQDGFEGLNYYPPNPALRFELEPEEFEVQQSIMMQTNKGDVRDFIRWGRVRFAVDGQPAELTLYLAPGSGAFFLPFVDATSGAETYGAGRYLDFEPEPDGRFIVDFNLAYNPYCAYNERWTCPLPPAENRLKVRIEAGEKNFHEQDAAS